MIQRLDRPSDDDTIEALFAAGRYGVSGAIPPGSDDPELDTRRQNVVSELNRRAGECERHWRVVFSNEGLPLPKWQMAVEYQGQPQMVIIRGSFPWAGIKLTITGPGGNFPDIESGEKTEYGVGGFERHVYVIGTYTITFLGEEFTIEVQSGINFVTFSQYIPEFLPDPAVGPDLQITSLVEAMQALFGPSFVVLPSFVPRSSAHCSEYEVQNGDELWAIAQRFGVSVQQLTDINDLTETEPITAGQTLRIPNSNELAQAFAQDNLLAGLDEQRVRRWLQQAALVHQPLGELEDTLMMTEVWRQPTDRAAEPALTLRVAQLPFDPENRWLGLADDERGSDYDIARDRGALSLVTAFGGPQDIAVLDTGPGEPRLAGLLLDQWDERIPAETVHTSVSFQYDGPNSQAPQCLLLAVPSQRNDSQSSEDEENQTWQVTDLAEIVKDTLDLAKVRAVDLDAMGEIEGEVANGRGVGLMLPGLLVPTNPDNPNEWARKTALDIITPWLLELVRHIWVDFRFELDEDVSPIDSPSIEVGSINIAGESKPIVIISGLIESSALLKGKYVSGQYAPTNYAALFPGNTEIEVELAAESLQVKLFVSWKDPAAVDLTVEDLEDSNLGISAIDENVNPVQLTLSYERIEDTWLWINEANAQFPLFAISIKGDGIKTLQLDLGETVLFDRISYYARSNNLVQLLEQEWAGPE